MENELKIVVILRKYIRAMGRLGRPVAVTAHQVEQLDKHHYLQKRDGRLWFDGQELQVVEEFAASLSAPAPEAVHARADDPEESHKALASFNRNGLAMRVLRELLNGEGDTGAIGERLDNPRENTSPVFCKLEAANLIVKDHISDGDKPGEGRRGVYKITDLGRAHLGQMAMELET